jgi:YVTN family beta-propeller protein
VNLKAVSLAAVAFGAAAIFGCNRVPAGEQLPLKQIADVPLPGNPTRLDYQSLDPRRQLLFIAHLGDSDVVVVDTKTRRVVATIPDISSVHGVLAVPELDTVYASATGTNELVAIDERTLKIKARTAGGVYPDGIAYDPVTKHLFVSDEHGNTDTVIDARSNRRLTEIPLDGEVGNTQYDPVSHHIFVNVQTLGQLIEIDPNSNAIVKRTSLAGCEGNHGLLIDDRRRRAFIACEDNAAFLWLDMRDMHIVKTWKIGDGPDVLAFNPQSHRLYVAAESGVVSVFSANTSVQRLAQGYLAPAAHTVAVDPLTRAVYFPLENIGGKPVLKIMHEK